MQDTAHRRVRFCLDCGQPPHTRTFPADGHRWRTTCDWPHGCDNSAYRGIEGTNPFGEWHRYYFCDEAGHLEAVLSGKAARDIQAMSERLGISTDITRPDIVATNKALSDHQNLCAQCQAVREWIASEMNAGHVQTISDRDRVGMYVSEHACAEGLELFAAVGRAMML